MLRLLQRVSSGVGRVWCRRMHPAPMWPIHNHYVCPTCQREWPVPWLENKRDAPCATNEEMRAVRTPAAVEQAFSPALSSRVHG
jgi:hypothetical protein